jgi:hypothetical protein
MDKVVYTEPGGMPLFLEGLDFSQQATRDTFLALMSAYGIDITEGFIISGCIITGTDEDGYDITEGYICVTGEIFKVDAHSIGPKDVGAQYFWSVLQTNDPAGNVAFADSTVKDIHKVRKARVSQGAVMLGNYMPMKAKNIHYRMMQHFPLQLKTINIGDWNMVGDVSVQVAHGLNFLKIKQVSVRILNDDPDVDFALFSDGGKSFIGSTNILLVREAGGQFELGDYDGTGFNRGYIDLWYSNF